MPSKCRSTQEQEKLDRELRELFEHKISFNDYLGFCIDELTDHNASIRFEMKNELVGHYYYGRLHGGVISAVLDAAAGLAVMWATCLKYPEDSCEQLMLRFNRLGTIDLRVDYQAPGNGKYFIAKANVLRLGGRVASTRMELHNDQGLLISTGAGAYIVS